MNNFEELIKDIQNKFSALNCDNIIIKDVNYGKQISLVKEKDKVTLTIYNGKKGIKMVWGGKEGQLQNAAKTIMGEKCETKDTTKTNLFSENKIFPTFLLRDFPNFNGLWAGSDESGKGDFFGPLVVAAVMLNMDQGKFLIENGIKDCKELTDKKIFLLNDVIKENIKTYVVLTLTPEDYNYRYRELQAQNKNLNNLLSLGHAGALNKVLAMNEKCNYVLVDRFAVNNTIEADVHKKFPKVQVIQRPKAEEDVAVAAASILARAQFLEVMDGLSKKIGIELPKGGGSQATVCAEKIMKTQGKEILKSLVKMHFANYKKL